MALLDVPRVAVGLEGLVHLQRLRALLGQVPPVHVAHAVVGIHGREVALEPERVAAGLAERLPG
eukprot:118880-Alexandrium_andersonii.AAC.1